jgi:hypothetical protein
LPAERRRAGAADAKAVIDRYCTDCHNDAVVKKVRGRMMPPLFFVKGRGPPEIVALLTEFGAREARPGN